MFANGNVVLSVEMLVAFEFYRARYPNRWDWPREVMWKDFVACEGSVTWRECQRSAADVVRLFEVRVKL